VRSDLQYWTALTKISATLTNETYWVDGSPSTFPIPWGPGEPSENTTCIQLADDQAFYDQPCSLLSQYICRMSASKKH
jgi:Lectin C-type domain